VGGFTNAVVGGAAKLIRFAIQSPNFVTGVSGWSINKDGTAEFQSLTARGSITATTLTVPAGAGPGTPRIVIDNVGLRFYGAGANPIYTMSLASVIQAATELDLPASAGIAIQALAKLSYDTGTNVLTLLGSILTANNPGAIGTLLLRNPANPDSFAFYGSGMAARLAAVFVGSPNDDVLAQNHYSRASNPDSLALDWILQYGATSPNNAALVKLGEHASAFRAMSVQPIPGGINKVAVGSAPPGGCYKEQWSFAAQVIPPGAPTTLTGLTTVRTDSDYPAAMNTATGVWTCPEDSWYQFTLAQGYTSGVAGVRVFVRATTGGGVVLCAQDITAPANTSLFSVSAKRFLTAGTTVHFETFQGTAANQTVAGASYATIGRDL
jgi:hypothetical protein